MLADVYPYPQTLEEFIEKWIQKEVVYNPDKIVTKLRKNGKEVKYHPVHPIGSPNRKYLEDCMKRDLNYLIQKESNCKL
jgi:hypothetical protein